MPQCSPRGGKQERRLFLQGLCEDSLLDQAGAFQQAVVSAAMGASAAAAAAFAPWFSWRSPGVVPPAFLPPQTSGGPGERALLRFLTRLASAGLGVAWRGLATTPAGRDAILEKPAGRDARAASLARSERLLCSGAVKALEARST